MLSSAPISRQQSSALLIALMSILVLATRVDLDFERVRTGISGPRAPEAGRLSFDLQDLGRLAGAPVALVVRIRGGADAVTVRVLFDGAPVASATVAAGDEIRIDGAITPSAGDPHRLELVGDRTDWRLRDAEIANVHGFSRGLASLVIVPAGRSRDHPLPFWALIPLAVGLLVWRPRWDWPPGRASRALHRAAVTLVCLLLLTTLAADWVTPYKLLLAPHTAFLALAVLYAEHGAKAWPRLRRQLESREDALRAVLAYVPYVATVAVFLWAIGQFYVPRAGFTPLIRFGVECGAVDAVACRAAPIRVRPAVSPSRR